jgi:hypothetical protein
MNVCYNVMNIEILTRIYFRPRAIYARDEHATNELQ